MGAKLDSQPVCVCCEEPIQDDHMYDIYGDIYCEDCMIAQFRRSID
nr:MAG TPA: DNA ligase IV [Caudoviricetes sp.]